MWWAREDSNLQIKSITCIKVGHLVIPWNHYVSYPECPTKFLIKRDQNGLLHHRQSRHGKPSHDELAIHRLSAPIPFLSFFALLEFRPEHSLKMTCPSPIWAAEQRDDVVDPFLLGTSVTYYQSVRVVEPILY
jgi:hypothetical protein